MKKRPTVLLALLSALASAGCATRQDPRENVADDLELPAYEVLRSDGPFEVRRYADTIAATTTVREPDIDAASRAGFRILAGYIFGGNEGRRTVSMTAPVDVRKTAPTGEAIAMTAPVAAAQVGSAWEIAFTMPSAYTMATLPVPNDARVVLKEIPGRCRAAVVFSGLTRDAVQEERSAALRAWIDSWGGAVEGGETVARYNDPLTLPWNRRNEILVDVGGPFCDGPAA